MRGAAELCHAARSGSDRKGGRTGPADERTRPEERNRTQESQIREHGDPAMRSMARREREKGDPKHSLSRPAKEHSSPKAQFCFFSKALRGKKKQIHFLKEFKLQMDLFFFAVFARETHENAEPAGSNF